MKHKDSMNIFVTSASQYGVAFAYIVNLHYIL